MGTRTHSSIRIVRHSAGDAEINVSQPAVLNQPITMSSRKLFERNFNIIRELDYERILRRGKNIRKLLNDRNESINDFLNGIGNRGYTAQQIQDFIQFFDSLLYNQPSISDGLPEIDISVGEYGNSTWYVHVRRLGDERGNLEVNFVKQVKNGDPSLTGQLSIYRSQGIMRLNTHTPTTSQALLLGLISLINKQLLNFGTP